jgi:hypothetical protein
MEQNTATTSEIPRTIHPQVDSTIIKLFLNSIKDGNLQGIKSSIEKYNFDVKAVRDPQLEQNVLFYAAVIPDDNT